MLLRSFHKINRIISVNIDNRPVLGLAVGCEAVGLLLDGVAAVLDLLLGRAPDVDGYLLGHGGHS